MKKLFSSCLVLFLGLGISTAILGQNWVPDPADTFGKGTTTNTSTSTNPDTFIPETKTEYKDANGITRKETIKTKDHDGNNVTKEKQYDRTGKLQKETETRSDPGTGRMVYSESKEYGYDGRVINGSKFERANDKYYFFDYDYIQQKYKDPRIVSSIPNKSSNDMACSNRGLGLTVGYSYLKAIDAGPKKGFPLGGGLEADVALNNLIYGLMAANINTSKVGDQSFSRTTVMAGIGVHPKQDCNNRPPISIFSRIAIGMMHERYKTGGSKAVSANAFTGSVGGGADINITPRFAVRVSGDYLLTFFNEESQSNYRFGLGAHLRLKK